MDCRKIMFVLIFLGILGGLLFLLGIYFENHDLKMLSKPAPVLVLIIILFISTEGNYSRLVLSGLICGMTGDILLEYSEKAFLFGLIAFLVGHIFYIAAFYRQRKNFSPLNLTLVMLVITVIYILLFSYLEEMKIPVAVYVLVIGVMLWRALAMMDFSNPEMYQKMAVIGALLFVISDTLLAWNRFHTPVPFAGYLIILLYWSAQAAIAASVLFLSGNSSYSADR